MNDLKIYYAEFAYHENKQWVCCRFYLAAKSTVNALNIIANLYGEVKMRKLEEVPLVEGMVFYG